MPDIAKLPELAEILKVSVDELLGEKSALVDAAINDTLEECILSNKTSAEDVSTVLPILKPKQVNTIVTNVNKFNGWKGINVFLPFMSEDDVKELAMKVLRSNG